MIARMDQVQWGRTTVHYSYTFAPRRTMAIHVHPDLSVSVVAPEGAALGAIREKVRKRAAWIRKSRREFELYLPKTPPRRYVSGETHRYLGRQYRLKAVQGEELGVKCLRGYLWVTTRAKPDSEEVARHLNEWYRVRAHVIFQERLSVCYERARRLGISPPPLTIRKLSTRWGSCTRAGRIILNLDLIKAPKDCIDYVITHELCHLKEHHHGPRFWRLLERVMPDYEERKRRLNLMVNHH